MVRGPRAATLHLINDHQEGFNMKLITENPKCPIMKYLIMKPFSLKELNREMIASAHRQILVHLPGVVFKFESFFKASNIIE